MCGLVIDARVMGVIAYGYAAFVVVWNVLRLTPVARWAPFELADLFGWSLFIPIPLIAIPVLVWRRWVAVVVLLLPIALFAVEYGPQFLPHRVPTGDAVQFVTANIYFRNGEPEAIEQMIRRSKADVIAIQELRFGMSLWLSTRLQERFPHQTLYPDRSSDGLGVLSRFPIVERRPPEMAAGQCRCHEVLIDVGSSEVLVINAHPRRPGVGLTGFSTSHQVPTVRALSQKIQASRVPVVVLGDLNIADRHRLFRHIRSLVGDAYRDAGWGLGLTWAHSRRWPPLVRIDYVLHDESWQTQAASTGSIPGSDHRYVTADLVQRPH